MTRHPLHLVFPVLVLAFLALCSLGCPWQAGPPIALRTASGLQTTEFEVGDSMLVEAVRLSPRTGYEVRIVDDAGEMVRQAMLSTDDRGTIPSTVLWYDIATRPCLESDVEGARLARDDLVDMKLAGRTYRLEFRRGEELARSVEFEVAAERTRPRLYAADARGCPRSGFLIGEQDVWVVGENLPPGSLVRLWAVTAGSGWQADLQLADLTKQYGGSLTPLIELGPGETRFHKLLWPKGLTSIGSYDIVAEVVSYPFGTYRTQPVATAQNLVADRTYSGFVIQRRPGVAEPLEQDAAGVRMSKLAYRDAFLTTENVFVGVDPYVHPSFIGKSAKVYIVADKTDGQWTTDPSLTDVTGFVEQVTIQPGACANCYSVLAWAAPLSLGKYDVVLDFNMDGIYTPGIDLIDSLDPVGFTVSEIRVDTITFRYSGSAAFPIYDNISTAIVSPPEYSVAGVRPAAWAKGGTHSVQVQFKAVPGVSSAQVWAEQGLGGLASAGSPVTLTLSGGSGQATLGINSPPSAVGRHAFDWEWKYKNVNGSTSADKPMGVTGRHLLYTTLSAPQPPMATPWNEVLHYATTWAAGETGTAGARVKIVAGIYNSGMVYDGGGHHTTGMGSFDLTAVLNELRSLGSGPTMYMDCRDCSNFFHVLTNSLGASDEYLRIPGPFTYEPLLPMGHGSCNSSGWNYHQVGWCSSQVADSSAKVSCPNPTTANCNLSATAYINLLTNTANINPGSTGICSPF